MDRETICEIGELVGEAMLGAAIGITASNTIIPKCETKIEKIMVVLGGSVGCWMIGRAWCKAYYKWFDYVFETDHAYEIKFL